MLFGEEISDFRASLGLSLSLSLYLISSLDITREFLEWTKDAEILLGLEIFTDWTREYKFCGAKLEGGCCCTLHEKNTIDANFGWCLISMSFLFK